MVFFGQVIVGPPGAGKSTFCHGMQQMCQALERKCVVVNLDPANDELPYECKIDFQSILSVEDVMAQHKLGPNGALMFCMDFLLLNVDWLEIEIKKYQDHYVIFDCPGQVELYTHHSALLGVLERLKKSIDARLTVVHLIDSVLCSDASKYLSALMVSLSSQILLNSPHVNCLTKIDLLREISKDLAFRLEYYAEVQDLRQLLRLLEASALTSKHPHEIKYRKLQNEICTLIEDFNLVAFIPLDINDKDSVIRILKQIDTANGFLLGDTTLSDPAGLFKVSMTPSLGLNEQTFGVLQERYIDVSDKDDDDDDCHVMDHLAVNETRFFVKVLLAQLGSCSIGVLYWCTRKATFNSRHPYLKDAIEFVKADESIRMEIGENWRINGPKRGTIDSVIPYARSSFRILGNGKVATVYVSSKLEEDNLRVQIYKKDFEHVEDHEKSAGGISNLVAKPFILGQYITRKFKSLFNGFALKGRDKPQFKGDSSRWLLTNVTVIVEPQLSLLRRLRRFLAMIYYGSEEVEKHAFAAKSIFSLVGKPIEHPEARSSIQRDAKIKLLFLAGTGTVFLLLFARWHYRRLHTAISRSKATDFIEGILKGRRQNPTLKKFKGELSDNYINANIFYTDENHRAGMLQLLASRKNLRDAFTIHTCILDNQDISVERIANNAKKNSQ